MFLLDFYRCSLQKTLTHTNVYHIRQIAQISLYTNEKNLIHKYEVQLLATPADGNTAVKTAPPDCTVNQALGEIKLRGFRHFAVTAPKAEGERPIIVK